MWIMLFAVLGGAGFVGYVFLTGQAGGLGGHGMLFGPKPEKRIDVVDQTSVDARRRLVLIRRDNVEHLIMTGGPVDVVIETGIGERPQPQPNLRPVVQSVTQPAADLPYTAPRQPRAFGQLQTGATVATKAAE
ncbi:MAG: flagellar biosynthetic protein FliO [Hyphomicrobiaceae bacterium]|nr:flagellar biosynthetic protein FliO [Hyphomicrobiaceae bacterium]